MLISTKSRFRLSLNKLEVPFKSIHNNSMKIKNVSTSENYREGYGVRAYSQFRKPKIYFNPEKETILENLENRRSRPYKEWQKLIPEALKRAGIPDPGYKWKWDPKAGCRMCPCSPGFVPSNMSSIPSNPLIGKSVSVTISL